MRNPQKHIKYQTPKFLSHGLAGEYRLYSSWHLKRSFLVAQQWIIDNQDEMNAAETPEKKTMIGVHLGKLYAQRARAFTSEEVEKYLTFQINL